MPSHSRFRAGNYTRSGVEALRQAAELRQSCLNHSQWGLKRNSQDVGLNAAKRVHESSKIAMNSIFTRLNPQPRCDVRTSVGQIVCLVTTLWLCAGCNPPIETLPVLKPESRLSMVGKIGNQGSGLTMGSGMTLGSGITLGSGVTMGSGITGSSPILLRRSSGTTSSGNSNRGGRIPLNSGSSYRAPKADTVTPATPQPKSRQVRFVSAPAVKVSLANFDELQAAIKKHAGKVVVVDVWSTSCLPCMKEFPNLVALSRDYPDRVACISLNVDFIGLKRKPPQSYVEKVEKFLVAQKAAFTNLLSTEADEDIRDKLKITSIPAILVYDQQGKLVHKLGEGNTGDDGLTYAGDVIPRVKELVSKPKA